MTTTSAAAESMYPRVVDELRGRLFTAGELARLTGVSERQVQRWSSGASRPDGDNRTRLLELRYIVEQLRELYSEEGVEIWLHGRNRALSGKRPIDLLEQGQVEPVIEFIEQLNTGAI